LPLPTFTFLQVGVKAIEFQALPGPEARALPGKTMRHGSFLDRAGPLPSMVQGGQAILSPAIGVFRCRGARPGARAARPILRKPSRISGQNSFPADAFSAQRPCFRATSLVWSRKRTLKVKGGKLFCPVDIFTVFLLKGGLKPSGNGEKRDLRRQE
jgi:hypothetical protein